MSDESTEVQLPDYVIEGARSSRSRCKTCRRKIDMGTLRIGILIEGPYGTGYMWHHLRCAAKRQFERVQEAYAAEAWNHAKEPPGKVPTLESLSSLREKAEQQKKERKTIPYAELDPSGRARCKHCGELIPKGSSRVVLGREIEFGSQVRTSPIQVHAGCVAAALEADDCNTEPESLAAALRDNSAALTAEQIDGVLGEIGNVG